MKIQTPESYETDRIRKRDLDPDPISQFARWFEAARSAGVPVPNAMVLATVGEDGNPSARSVLLKGFNQEGFCFVTNYESLKGKQLAKNPRAALVFYWQKQNRQVRISGRVSWISPQESDAYFQSRPIDSQLSAWASRQSQIVENLEILLGQRQRYKEKFRDENIPRPPFWGGYRVSPNRFEFWQSGPHRLHDRFQYSLQPNGTWNIERLAP